MLQSGFLRYAVGGLLGLLCQFSITHNLLAQTCSTVSTLAGLPGQTGSTDDIGSAARFDLPAGLAVGNPTALTANFPQVYIADSGNQTIRRITPQFTVSGVVQSVTTLAGLAGNVGSANGTGSAASFSNPTSAALDAAGNIYIADTNNNAIRKITSAGVVTTLAFRPGSAVLASPQGIVADGVGNLYVANTGDDTILKITGELASVFAGSSGNAGSADGVGADASFSSPRGIALDGNGNVYVADTGNHTIRQVTPDSEVSTIAGEAGAAGSQDSQGGCSIKTGHCPPTVTPHFNSPAGVAVDGAGYVFVADTGNDTIREITPDGTVSTLAGLAGNAGSASGVGSVARFNAPTGIAVDLFGNLYVADTNNSTIRKISTCLEITDLTPSTGLVGSSVTITGRGFAFAAGAQNTVTFFDDFAATVTSASYSSLTVTVPQYASTGPVTVTTSAGTATSPYDFTVTMPSITGFTPSSGPIGTPVTITGTLFDPTSANNTVTFNGVAATVSAATSTTLSTNVPPGATTGPIKVVDIYGWATSLTNFLVTPTFTSFNQSSGHVNDVITITGTGFDPNRLNDSVTFYNGVATTVSAATATTLTVTVPSGATTGPVTITTSGGSVQSSSFQVIPTFASFSAPNGHIADVITITGTGFDPNKLNDSVKFFNNITATISAATATTLTVTVPAGATTGPLTIATSGGSVPSTNFLVTPTFGSFSAPNGRIADVITITGTGFDPNKLNDTVKFFNNIAATISAATATTLTVTVPAGATTGPVTITTAGGSVQSANFLVVPTFASLSASSGHVADALTITGTGFDPNRLNDGVMFYNGMAATVSAATATTLTVTVPFGATTGPVTVTTAGGSVPSSSFQVIPTFASFSAPNGRIADVITITGTGFDPNKLNDTVKFFNNITATISAATATTLTVTVPAGATTGPVTITTAGGSVPSANFLVVPTFLSFSVPSGSVGSAVTITGTGYDLNPLNNAVKFSNNVAATVSSSTASMLNVTVPSGAVTGPITVTTSGGSVTSSPTNFTVLAQPNAPVSVSVPANSSTASVTVSWTPSSSGAVATYYQLQRKLGTAGTWGFANSNILAPATSYVDTVPGAGTYYYELDACSTSGCSAYTVTPAPVTVGAAPVTLPALPSPVTDAVPFHDATVGTMEGQPGTDGGAATYNIPIVVPPGRAGMQPSLSVNYNSRSGNGIMGLGWTLSGLSSIHRCPQTPEQDGATLGVSYTNNDRLCLDGQRLVVVNGSTYGASGAQYRTEVDSYARITQTGGNLTGSATCFRVEQKDGRILHYGAVTTGSPTATACSTSTANARVLPAGAAASLSWMVEKIEDRVGNNQLYSYTNVGNGEVLLHTVTYTGSGAAAGDRAVTLSYQARTAVSGVNDVSSSYLGGGLTMQTQALASITTTVGGTTVRTYAPHYVVAAYSQRLLMASLQECAGGSCNPALTTCPTNIAGTACHPPTRFVYNDAALNTPTNFPLTALNLQSQGLPSSTYAASPYSLTTIADLDGDGARETAVTDVESDGKHSFLVQFTGDRAVQHVLELTGTPFQTAVGYADIDGDGRSELIETPQSSAADQHVAFGVWNSATFPRGQPATSNPFITVPSGSPISNAIPFTYGSDGPVYSADINGDGKVDIVVVKPDVSCGANSKSAWVYLNNTSGPLTSAASFGSGTRLFCLTRVTAGSLFHEPTIDHIADFNGDGMPDFYLVYVGTDASNGTLAGINLVQPGGTGVSALTCGQAGFLTADECSGNNNYYTRWMDINGDGLEDFVIARPGGNWQVRLNQGGTLRPAIVATGTDGLDIYATGGTPTTGFKYLGKLPVLDVDGDGKPDLTVPSQTQGIHGFALKMCTIVHVTAIGAPDAPHCPIGTPSGTAPMIASAQSGPAICPVYACPEDPASTVGTTKKLAVNLPLNTEMGDSLPYPYQWKDENGNTQAAFNLYDSDAVHGGAFTNDDNSTYHLSMLKFVQTDANSITVSRVETPLTSRLNNGGGNYTQPDDLFGDGLVDVISPIGCSAFQQQFPSGNLNNCQVVGDGTFGPDHLLDGPDGTVGTLTTGFNVSAALYASVNQGVPAFGGSPNAMKLTGAQEVPRPHGMQITASVPLLDRPILPGLMDAAANGLGDVASWGYLPLSVPESDYGFPLYSIPAGTGYADRRHYYFESSMPVVYGMLQSPAVGSDYGGFRSAVYGYSQAMYNHFGRGFQGFYQILTKVYVPTVATTDMQARAQQTLATYNQKFPLTGKVATIVKSDAATGVTFQKETDTWGCTRSARTATCAQGDTLAVPTGTTVYQPFLDDQLVQNFDLSSGAQTSHIDTLNAASAAAATSGWDNNTCGTGSGVYGNLNNQLITRVDDASGGVFVTGHTTATTDCFDVSGSASWWVNKLTSHSATASIAYAGSHALPSGASAPSQTVATSFSWNADRTPATKTVQAGVLNQQSTTTYTYPAPSYGLPTQVQVNAPDLAAALSPTRTTGYSYTKNGSSVAADGYFVLTTTNGLNQSTTTTHQVNDGQVLSASDPNNVQIATSYDPFGRATLIQHLGNTGAAFESPVQMAYTACASSSCPGGYAEDGNETNAAYRITTVQAGYPTHVSWYDVLGREIKTAERGYTGAFIETVTDYDDLGTAAEKSAPFYSGNAAYLTGWSYDAMNRPIVKIAPGGELNSAEGNVETDYIYTGRQTTVLEHATAAAYQPVGNVCPSGAGNLCMKMTRSTNVLGQYMQTVDAKNGATNYWTEPLGHVAAMTDAEGNITFANYNALGQRFKSVDQDQGLWNFTYDAFGELLTQTDARNVVTTVNVRDVLGRTREQQAIPPATIPGGLANETLLDDWTFDPTSGIGELGSATRKRGSSRTAPASNPQVWQENYGYETSTARPSTIVTTINDGSGASFSSAMNYDADGRPNTHTYPSNLVVQTQYARYGHPGAMANATTGQIYWEATTMDAWGKVLSEKYVDGTNGTIANYQSTGQEHTASWTLGGSTIDSLTYGYDSFGNLINQNRHAGSAINTETYGFDNLQRLTSSTRSGSTAVSYGYSASGNLTDKTDFSTSATNAYSYSPANTRNANGCGPHAAYSVALASAGSDTYSCDANGNVYGGNTLAISYDADNHPRTTTRAGAGSTTWAYDVNGQRDYESSSQGTRYFGPAGYEQVGTKAIHELGPIIISRVAGVDTITTSLRDRLGSTIDTIDSGIVGTGSSRAYDAFGKVRNGDMSDKANGTLNLGDTIHGFTKHEHADDVWLIHMGGRIYDYQLGRFLNVDPIVGNPVNSQSLNPYSYIGNNPLSGVDPTGYEDCVVTQGNSCTANAHDSRSADSFSGRVTFVMGGDTNVRSYSSEGGSALVINNSGGNGAVGMGAQGAGGIKNAQAGALDQLGLTNAPNNNGIPANVVKECQGYSLPASCEGKTNDQAVGQAAATHVAAGDSPIDPTHSNPDVAAETSTTNGVVTTALKYSGNVSDATVNSAADDWTGNGLKITPIHRGDNGSGLNISMTNTPDIAGKACMSSCLQTYINGLAGITTGNTIYLDRNQRISLQRIILDHELGHYFFGKGHPKKPSDFGAGGVLDYKSLRVNSADRMHFRELYQTGEVGGVQ